MRRCRGIRIQASARLASIFIPEKNQNETDIFSKRNMRMRRDFAHRFRERPPTRFKSASLFIPEKNKTKCIYFCISTKFLGASGTHPGKCIHLELPWEWTDGDLPEKAEDFKIIKMVLCIDFWLRTVMDLVLQSMFESSSLRRQRTTRTMLVMSGKKKIDKVAIWISASQYRRKLTSHSPSIPLRSSDTR